MKKSQNRDIEAAKSFLENERRPQVPPPLPPKRPSGSSNPIQDLIKCFCGVCESFFKRSVIEYALKANGDEILRNPESREVLKKFLIFKKGNSNFKLQADDLVELYALSYDIVEGNKDLEEERADLDDLIFNEFWEDKLVNAIDDGTTDDYFHDLMRECANRFENTPEYLPFKEELKKKLQ